MSGDQVVENLWIRDPITSTDEESRRPTVSVVADKVPLDNIRAIAGSLPLFMRPSCVAVMAELPRDTGVGKVQRRLLNVENALEVLAL